jgi:hypothetical protein
VRKEGLKSKSKGGIIDTRFLELLLNRVKRKVR